MKRANPPTDVQRFQFTMQEPISVRIPVAIAMTGFSRSRLYELIASGEIEIAKDGASTLVIVSSLRASVEKRRRSR